jgi:type VI secretion system protein VasJ
VAGLGAGESLEPWLRTVGDSLTSAAVRAREASPTDPTAYRLLRTGIWLGTIAEPPSQGGRTLIPPPDRARLDLLLQAQNWAELLSAAESACAEFPLWLDPHRYAWQAMGGLGAGHQKGRDAVVAELRSLVGRLPGLLALSFSNGTPLADQATRDWLEEQAGAGGGKGRAAGAGDALSEGAAAKLAEAKTLLGAAQVAQGLQAVQEAVGAARNDRERFRVRLEAARLYVSAGLKALAQGAYQDLDREAQARALDAWEPALAAECLRGLIAATRALPQDPRGVSPDLVASYRRLCGLDPASANEVWP